MEAFKEKIRARLYWLFWALALFLIPVFYSDLVLKSWSWWARGFHLKTVGYVYISVVMGILFAKRYKKSLC
jgi:hypothetical protein